MFEKRLDDETVLRMLMPEHAGEVFGAVDSNREHLREWLPWVDATRSVEDTSAFIQSCLKKLSENGAFEAGIWHQGKYAGTIGFHPIHKLNQHVSIGYWLSKDACGKGIMRRATHAFVDHALRTWNLKRVEIHCATGNVRSQNIPAKLGFTREGVLRSNECLYGRWVDHVVFSMLREEWPAS